jgi:hypothetical protein
VDLSEIVNGAEPQLQPPDFSVPYWEFAVSADGQVAANAGYIGSEATAQGFAVWNTRNRNLISSKIQKQISTKSPLLTLTPTAHNLL